MKPIMVICLLVMTGAAHAAEKAPVTPAIRKTQAALEGLSLKLDLGFRLPFPADWDIDPYLKRPIARLMTTQGEMCCVEPVVNLFDGDGTVEWHLGPTDTKQFGREHVYCFLSFDERGDILHLGILTDDDWFSDGSGGTHQIIREDGEAPGAFLSRAFLEFHRRSVSSSDPQKAMLYLSGVERVTQAVCELRKTKEVPSYPATARP